MPWWRNFKQISSETFHIKHAIGLDCNKLTRNKSKCSEQSEFVVLVLVDAVWHVSKQISSNSELKVSNKL